MEWRGRLRKKCQNEPTSRGLQPSERTLAQAAFLVIGDQDARGYNLDASAGERLSFAGAVFLVKASTEMTAGAFSIIEELEPLDTPLHAHANEDELFYVPGAGKDPRRLDDRDGSCSAPPASMRTTACTRFDARSCGSRSSARNRVGAQLLGRIGGRADLTAPGMP